MMSQKTKRFSHNLLHADFLPIDVRMKKRTFLSSFEKCMGKVRRKFGSLEVVN